jgi:hypothetical protein
MSVGQGLLLAYLKIGTVAFTIMAVLWLIIRAIEKRGREKSGKE